MKKFWEMFLLAPEGEGAGAAGDGATNDAGAGDGAGAAAAAGGAAAAGQAAGGEGAAQPYRPDGLPDQYIGANERETIDKLWGATKGFRDAQAKHEPAPADVAGYAFEWSKDVEPYAKDFGEDAFFKGVKEDALKAGLGNKQANAFLDGVMNRMISMQLVDAPVDVEAEKLKLAPEDAKGLPAPERDAAIQRRVTNNVAYVDSMVAKGFPKEAAEALGAELAAFPALNQLVEFMRGGTGGDGPALGGGSAAAATKADLAKRSADPRGRVGEPGFDPAFAAETTRLYKEVYPG